MSRATQPYKRSFSASVGSGLGSIIGGAGKQYYILEHKINSKYHKMGEAQEIIVDNIELGRDAKCQVRYDDSFETVSRRHAAIVKDSNNWKLIHLSSTNPTLLNGRTVGKEWFLQSGDDIELSVGGPKLRFIVPTGSKATIGSIGLTRRLSLFGKQALRPYKTIITILSVALLLSVGGLSTWIFKQNAAHKVMVAALEEQAALLKEDAERQEATFNALISEQAVKLEEAEARNEALKKEMESKIARLQATVKNVSSSVHVQSTNNKAIALCEPYVYFVRAMKLEVTFLDGTKKDIDYGWTGSGFLLEDGRFVTARHVSEPWFYFVEGGEVNEVFFALNKVANNGGKVVAHLGVFSSSGDNFTIRSDQFTCGKRNDRRGVDDDGLEWILAPIDETDWSFCRTSKREGLKHDSNKSVSLERGTSLTVLGFPFGRGANSATDIIPQLSFGTTTAPGLTNNRIMTTNTSYETGNSGGPVFYNDPSGNLTVVGIVSAGTGRSTGFVVPIALIDKN